MVSLSRPSSALRPSLNCEIAASSPRVRLAGWAGSVKLGKADKKASPAMLVHPGGGGRSRWCPC